VPSPFRVIAYDGTSLRGGYRDPPASGTTDRVVCWPPWKRRWTSVKLSRVIGIAAVLLIIWFIVTNPTAAANSVEAIGATLERWAGNVTSFFTQIVT
jgi:hypothetical protein